jgi:hypothetical protein
MFFLTPQTTMQDRPPQVVNTTRKKRSFSIALLLFRCIYSSTHTHTGKKSRQKKEEKKTNLLSMGAGGVAGFRVA